MTKKEESKLKSKIRKELMARRFYYCNVAQGLVGSIPGEPDIILCLNGEFIGLEFKSRTGEQKKAQERREELIKRNGGKYFLIRTYSEWVDFCVSEGLYGYQSSRNKKD